MFPSNNFGFDLNRIFLQDVVATPERPLLTEDFPSSSPEHINAQNQNDVVTSHIYHEIPENHQPIHQIQKSHQIPENHQQPIHRPIQAQLFHHQQLGGSNFSNNQQQQPLQGGSNFINNQQRTQQGGLNFSNNQQPLQCGSSSNSTSSSGYVLNCLV